MKVSVLKVCNTSESSHHYLGAVLFDVMSCTSYLRFVLCNSFRGEGASISRLVNVTLIVCSVSAGV
jgi:hypothetical protein